MPDWKKVAIAVVLLAVMTVPAAIWAGVQLLPQHVHELEAGHAHHDHGLSDLAEILVHGHEHREGVPDHQHNFLPSPPVRPVLPLDLQTPGIASLQTLDTATVLLPGVQAWSGEIGLSGSSPPRLHLLCTLLI
ncbi:MAG TPA: hypothetical protein VE078_06350 [Thermoanaerobaculia bacterium]|nr:hypothetical protein [Thermoanaerobaculia bacterium]